MRNTVSRLPGVTRTGVAAAAPPLQKISTPLCFQPVRRVVTGYENSLQRGETSGLHILNLNLHILGPSSSRDSDLRTKTGVIDQLTDSFYSAEFTPWSCWSLPDQAAARVSKKSLWQSGEVIQALSASYSILQGRKCGGAPQGVSCLEFTYIAWNGKVKGWGKLWTLTDPLC